MRLSGEIFPTMITPYLSDGNVDLEGVKKIVDWYYKKGCDGIFSICQSSEIMFLSLEERLLIAKTVVERCKELEKLYGRKMRVIGSGHVADDFNVQVEELTKVWQTGVEAVVLITNRLDIENTSEEKWIADLHKLIEALPRDIVLGAYECPKPYKRLLTANMLKTMKESGKFKFIKDTCCNADTIKERLAILKDSGVELYNANAQTLLETVRAGAKGYSGIMANFHPEIYSYMLKNADGESADIIQSYLAMSAGLECYTAYPSTAKYYLKEYEGIDITTVSRSVDCSLIDNYQKSCYRQMKILGDNIKKQFNI